MKNLKKLLAVIVAVCVLATMTVPAFAAASDAEICEALGILQGDGAGVTDTYLAKGTERYQAAIIYLRLIGKEEEAKAFTGEDNFDDADQIYKGGQRILAYLKANPDLGWTGVGGNKFEPTNPASAQMIYKVLLEALGYKQDVDFKWAETLDLAESVGLSAIADIAELTNADVATALVEGLKAKVKDSDATLAEKLVADGIIDEAVAAEYGLVEVAPATFEVVSASADNLKEVVVVFNRAVDGDTVNADNIKVDGKAGSVSLNDDKVTAVITIDGDGLENQADYKAVISGVKSAAGVEIEKTEVSFKAFDATLPVAEKITVTGPKNFTITFSEPIKKGENGVEVKSGTSVIGVNPSFGTGGRDVTVDLYSSLADGKTYEITVKNFEDYAGYKNVVKTFSLAYAKDNSAPTATVEKVDQKYVKVKFNKPVTGLIKEMFWHTFTAWKALGIYSDEAMTTAIEPTHSVDTVWVKFANAADDGKPIAEGTTRFGILGKATGEGGTSYEIKDNWDNKFETAEFTITVSADKTAPTVEELTVETERTLKIKFSEDVVLNKDNVKDKVKIYDTDGKSIDGVSVTVSGSGKEYTIDLGKELPGKTIVVEIKDVEDTALQPNRMATYTTSIEITDKKAPSISKVTKKESENALYVFYSEAVDGTAIEKANYALIDPVSLSLTLISKDPAFFDGNTVVKIELSDKEWTKINAAENPSGLFVQKVKDLAGNAIAGTTIKANNILAHDADGNKPSIAKIEVVAADRVEVTFNQYLKRIDKDAFTVNGTTPAAMEYTTNSDGNTVVTLKPASGHEFAPDLNDAELVVDVSGSYKLLNIFDVAAKNETKTAAAGQMIDKIAPSIATKEGGDYKITVTTGSTITIEFDEAIEDGALSNKTFEVKDKKITGISSIEDSSDSKTVTITLENSVSAGDEVSITQNVVRSS
jgi:methionine-rich copper-binding protein CopC